VFATKQTGQNAHQKGEKHKSLVQKYLYVMCGFINLPKFHKKLKEKSAQIIRIHTLSTAV
jgi:uncharacterized protein YunC (DUF1805 family)